MTDAQERLRLFVASLDIAEEIADQAFADIAALTPAPLDDAYRYHWCRGVACEHHAADALEAGA